MTVDHVNNLRLCVAQYAASLALNKESPTSACIIDPSTNDFFGKVVIQPTSVRNVTFHHFESNFHTSATDYLLPDVSTIDELKNHPVGKALLQNFSYEIAAHHLSIAPSRKS